MDALLASLTEHQRDSPREPIEVESVVTNTQDQDVKAEPSSSPAVMTPASNSSSESEAPAKEDETMTSGKAEMLRLQKELDAAKQQLEMQKRELDQNRIFSQTFEQAMSPSGGEVRASKASSGNDKNAQIRQQATSFAASQSGVPRPDFNLYSDNFDTRSATNYNNILQAQWAAAQSPVNLSPTRQQFQQPMANWAQAGTATRPFNPRAAGQGMPPTPMLQHQPLPHQRILSGPPSPGTIGDGRFVNDVSQFQSGFGVRRNDSQIPRKDAFAPQQRGDASNGWGVIGNGIGGLEAMNIGMNSNNTYQSMGMYQSAMPYQPRPIGTPLSATATEFRADEPPANPWNASVGHVLR